MADGDELVSIDPAVDVDSINDVLASFTASDLLPLIDLDPVVLRRMRETAMLNLGRPVADLTQFFRVSVDADAEDLVAALLQEDLVEGAYEDSGELHVQGDIDPETCQLDDYSAEQTNLGPAPVGLGVTDVQDAGEPEHRGAGMTVVDIEMCWIPEHEDLQDGVGDGRISRLGPMWEVDDSSWDDDSEPECPPRTDDLPEPANMNRDAHGTADLGVLAADDDAVGIDGMVTEATVRYRTVWPDTVGNDGPRNVALAIMHAALRVCDGGGSANVILLEICATSLCGVDTDSNGENDLLELVPIETRRTALVATRPEYQAILTAVGNGIHVVEAACNGDDDLAQYRDEEEPCDEGPWSFRYGARDSVGGEMIDSGAILVGAGTDENRPKRWREPSVPAEAEDFGSNFCNRIDVFARGSGIHAPGYGILAECGDPPDFRQDWSDRYRATSAASVQIAGCVTILAGDHQVLHDEPYQPSAMRLMLRTSGTLSDLDDVGTIGRQPNLEDQTEIVAMGPQPAHVFNGNEGAVTGLGPYKGGVAAISDVNGDGVRDLLVGAPTWDDGPPADRGAAFVFSGMTGDLLRSHFGPDLISAQFGMAIAVADVNNDDHDDYAIGAPGKGRVFVFNGENGDQICEINSGLPNSGFGSSLDLGDLNSNGVADEFAIGAPRFNSGDRGHVGVFRVVAASSTCTSFFSFDSPAGEGDSLGDIGTLAIADASTTGGAYLVVGGPAFDLPQPAPDPALDKVGHVRAFHWIDLNGPNNPPPETMVTVPLSGRTGLAEGDQFGRSVTAFDMLGSGDELVAIGAPGHDSSSLTDNGEVLVMGGGSSSYVYRTLDGTASDEQFGSSMANAGDFDGDRSASNLVQDDLLVASSGDDTVGIFVDGSSDPHRTYTKQSSGGAFGNFMSGAGDLNGACCDEVIIADPEASSNNGRVYVFFGPAPISPAVGCLSSCICGPYVNGENPIQPTTTCDAIEGAITLCNDEWFLFDLEGAHTWEFTTCDLSAGGGCADGAATPRTQLELHSSDPSCTLIARTLPADACSATGAKLLFTRNAGQSGVLVKLRVTGLGGELGAYTLTHRELPP